MKKTFIPLMIIVILSSCQTHSPFKVRPTQQELEQMKKDEPTAIEDAKSTFLPYEFVFLPEESATTEEPATEESQDITITTVDESETISETQQNDSVESFTDVVEITQTVQVEQAETIVDTADEIIVNEQTSEPAVEKTVLQSIEDTIRGEGEPKEAIVAGNVLPMWFCYTFSFLFLCVLFTMCYISSNRKWRRIRGD